jgi:hypothetical protein
MRAIVLGLIWFVAAANFFTSKVLADQIDVDYLKKAFELGESCKQKCKSDSIDMVRLPLPKGKVGFLMTKRDRQFCSSGVCPNAVVVVSGDHFIKLKEGQGITKAQALAIASEWSAPTAEVATPSPPSLPSQPNPKLPLTVDVGNGRDIRGLKVGMRQGHLPAEFNSLGVTPSTEMPAAEVIGTCSGEGYSGTCVHVFFDASDPERPAYAVRLSNLRLGQFRDAQMAEDVITAKYGSPRQSSRDALKVAGSFFAPVYNYMIWDNSVDFTKSRIYGLSNLAFMNPAEVERRLSGYQNEGAILIVEITLKIPQNMYYATIASVDVKTAFKVYRASNKIEEIRSATRLGFDQTPAPRF